MVLWMQDNKAGSNNCAKINSSSPGGSYAINFSKSTPLLLTANSASVS